MPVMKRFMYKVEMSYIESSGKEHKIVPNTIEYIMTNYDFDRAFMPILAVKLKLDASLYAPMIKDQGAGKVYLNISKYCSNSTSTALTKYISEQFDYIMTNDPNKTTAFDDMVEGEGVAYKVCMIGLVKKKLIEQNQKQFNGIYRDTNMATLIMMGMQHIDKVVIEPLANNTSISTIKIPEVKSLIQYLTFLNSKYNFYSDQYIFFMDLEKTYLKSNSGKWMEANDGQHKYVAFDIRDTINSSVTGSGMVIDDKQDAYIIYIDPNDAKVYTDQATPQTTATIVTIDDQGSQQQAVVDTSGILSLNPDTQSTFYLNTNDPKSADYIANVMKNNAVTVVVSKTDIDTSVITPNKEYLISNYEGNQKYTGRYYLAFKKELFYNSDQTHFSCATNIGLTMVIHY